MNDGSKNEARSSMRKRGVVHRILINISEYGIVHMRKMTEGKAGSFYNFLSDGCKLCQLGSKMVLFITGKCERSCFYCPVSAERKRDVVYANERHVRSDEDVINEVRQMSALGTGITGGEPLMERERVLHYIRLLKSEFGPGHHIHLYTSIAPQKDVLAALAEAGLDEIRFHPPLELWNSLVDTPFADSIRNAIKLDISVGIEVPAIKGAEKIADFINSFGGFLNLNELEFSDTNAAAMRKRGFELHDDMSNAVLNSRLCAQKIAPSCAKVHFCSSRYKDAVQLKNRLLRTAENTSRIFDEVTEEGTIAYGVIKNSDLRTSLEILYKMEVPDDMFEVKNGRIEIAWWILEDIADLLKEAGSILIIIERYPFEGGLVVQTIPV